MSASDIDDYSPVEPHELDEFSDRTFRGSSFAFTVLSRSRVRYAVITEPYIVISISDSGDVDAEIADSPLCHAILRRQFDDVDPQLRSLRGGFPMTTEDAHAIRDFVRLQTEQSGTAMIVCQCGLGISRSAAIAAALSKHLQGEDAFFFTRFSPNLHVYKTLLAAVEDEERNRMVA